MHLDQPRVPGAPPARPTKPERPLRRPGGRARHPDGLDLVLRIRSPAVSVRRIGIPPSANGTSIWSRVVPGTSVTMARSSPAITLIRLDFTDIRWAGDDDSDAVLERLDPGPLEPSPSSAASSHIRASKGWSIAHRLRHSRSPARPLRIGQANGLPFLNLFAQPTFGERQCGLTLVLGLRLDQVGQTFGLGKIDAAVLERAARELARLRCLRPSSEPRPHSTASTTARPPWQ